MFPSVIRIRNPCAEDNLDSQAYLAKFSGISGEISSQSQLYLPAHIDIKQPRHLRKRFKRGQKAEPEPDVNLEDIRYKLHDRNKIFHGHPEGPSEPTYTPAHIRRPISSNVLLVKKGDDYACVFGSALQTLMLRTVPNIPARSPEEAEVARRAALNKALSCKNEKLEARAVPKPSAAQARQILIKGDVKPEAPPDDLDAVPLKSKKLKEEDDSDVDKVLDSEEEKTPLKDQESASSSSEESEDDSEEAITPKKSPIQGVKRGRDISGELLSLEDVASKKPKTETIEVELEQYLRGLLVGHGRLTIKDVSSCVKSHFGSRVGPPVLVPVMKKLCMKEVSEVDGQSVTFVKLKL